MNKHITENTQKINLKNKLSNQKSNDFYLKENQVLGERMALNTYDKIQ